MTGQSPRQSWAAQSVTQSPRSGRPPFSPPAGPEPERNVRSVSKIFERKEKLIAALSKNCASGAASDDSIVNSSMASTPGRAVAPTRTERPSLAELLQADEERLSALSSR